MTSHESAMNPMSFFMDMIERLPPDPFYARGERSVKPGGCRGRSLDRGDLPRQELGDGRGVEGPDIDE